MQTLLKLVKSQWVLVIIFSVVIFFQLQSRGRLKHHIAPDTGGYTSIVKAPFGAEWLQKVRTVGYPIFLIVSEKIASVEDIPVMHFLFFVVSVCLFSLALQTLGVSALCNAIICLCLLKSKIFIFNPHVVPDVIACAAAIAAAGCTLALMKPTAHKGWWFGLAASVCYSYQLKPVYLCMIPFAIIGIIIGRYLYERFHSEDFQTNYQRLAIGVVAVAVIPFLGFCTLRYFVVDHFGIVAFGGYSAAGVGGCLLEQEDVAALPTDLQPLAQEIIDRRNNPEVRLQGGRKTTQWQPVVDREKSLRINYENFVDQYDFVLYWATLRASREKLTGLPKGKAGKTFDIVVNQRLSRLSHLIFKRHREDYAYLIGNSFLYSFQEISVTFRAAYRLLRWGAILFVIRLLVVFVAKKRYGIPSQFNKKQYTLASLIGGTALLFFLGNIGVISFVEVPYFRYLCAAVSLLPAAAVAFLFADAETIIATISRYREQTKNSRLQNTEDFSTEQRMAA